MYDADEVILSDGKIVFVHVQVLMLPTIYRRT